MSSSIDKDLLKRALYEAARAHPLLDGAVFAATESISNLQVDIRMIHGGWNIMKSLPINVYAIDTNLTLIKVIVADMAKTLEKVYDDTFLEEGEGICTIQ